VAPAAQQRAHAERTSYRDEQPFHVPDATLARLPATPVAPSTRSGANGAGPLQSMGSLDF